MAERRVGNRFHVIFLMRARGDGEAEWLGVSRNMSQSGALFVGSARPNVGEEVTLCFEGGPVDRNQHIVKGTVVRFEPNAEDPNSLWPHRVAVEFEEPIPALEPLLESASDAINPERKEQTSD
jgi:hypothetical protein